MGNFCLKDYEGKIVCIKCNDRYKPVYGGKSERSSCRKHRFDGFYCKDCPSNITLSYNCYHTYE